jgi:F-box-like
MSINSLPNEILFPILAEAVELQTKAGVQWTYGLSKLPDSRDHRVPTKTEKYVRGQIPDYQAKWDGVALLRLVCKRWHSWALEYAVHDVYVSIWKGSERWFDLTTQRGK